MDVFAAADDATGTEPWAFVSATGGGWSVYEVRLPFDRDGRITFAIVLLALLLQRYATYKVWFFRIPAVALARHGTEGFPCRRDRRVGLPQATPIRSPGPAGCRGQEAATVGAHSGRRNALSVLFAGATVSPGNCLFRHLDASTAISLAACSRECARSVEAWMRVRWAAPHRHDDEIEIESASNVPAAAAAAVSDAHVSAHVSAAAATTTTDSGHGSSGCNYVWIERAELRTNLMSVMPLVHGAAYGCAYRNFALRYFGSDAERGSRDLAHSTACIGPTGGWPLELAHEDTALHREQEVKIRACVRRGHSLPLVHFPLASLDTRVPRAADRTARVAAVAVVALLLFNSETLGADILHAVLGEIYSRVPRDARTVRTGLSILRMCVRIWASSRVSLPRRLLGDDHRVQDDGADRDFDSSRNVILLTFMCAIECAVPEVFHSRLHDDAAHRWTFVFTDLVIATATWRVFFAYALTGLDLGVLTLAAVAAPFVVVKLDELFRSALRLAPATALAAYARWTAPVYAHTFEIALLGVTFFHARRRWPALALVAAALLKDSDPTSPWATRLRLRLATAYREILNAVRRLGVRLVAPCARHGVQRLAALRAQTLGGGGDGEW